MSTGIVREITPEVITVLEPGQVFVFGSNAEGQHVGGAARTAWREFGAVWGIGQGLQGRSYAIPTMGSFRQFEIAAEIFLLEARGRQDLRFLLTPVGCGIAGWTADVVAPLFAEAPANVWFPQSFVNVLEGGKK